MKSQSIGTGKRLFYATVPFLVLWFSMPAATAASADTSFKPGSYCPDTNILLIVAEEISASLDQVTRSKAALTGNDRATAIGELNSARTTLHLATSRGAAARTRLLIDAIVQAKAGEDYAQMLTWFPLLHTSLLTLSDDAVKSATIDLIGRAEEIMQGGKTGDPLALLKQAQQMLACDSLNIPLQEAVRAQDALMKQLSQGYPDKNGSYDLLLNSLRSALLYTLGKH
jgi:hypothetical protein